MSAEIISQSVLSQNTFVYGRTLNSARTHHFVVDGTRDPKEELTPVEVFLSGVSSCCIQWIEQLAREAGVRLDRLTARIEGLRIASEPTRFQYVQVDVDGIGPTQAELESFVDGFKSRCPLYATVAAATEVRFTVSALKGNS